MNFDELLYFLKHEMRMSHIYQPVMIRHLLQNNGKSDVDLVAKALLLEDQSQIDYYKQITHNMVGRVLRSHGVAEREKTNYELNDFEQFTPEQIAVLTSVCNERLAEYIESRGKAIWEHRRKSSGYISGTIRYEVLKAAKFHCELCGISADEKALEVDHIVPRNKGGIDELANLQALCYSCNAMKQDRDDTDFRMVRTAFDNRNDDCPFCGVMDRPILFANSLALAFEDTYPASKGHVLVVPRRHEASYFELGYPEIRACNELLAKAKVTIEEGDSSVVGFNMGLNYGEAAGQTVMHCHVHLIPRRKGDHPNPRGGVRCVIPGMADYIAEA